MGKNNVAAFVPHEAMIIDVGTSMASDVIGFLIKRPVLITKFMQTISRTQTSGTAPDDNDSLAVH
jgi:hypothetical protein